MGQLVSFMPDPFKPCCVSSVSTATELYLENLSTAACVPVWTLGPSVDWRDDLRTDLSQIYTLGSPWASRH